jgi:hypothetical protein
VGAPVGPTGCNASKGEDEPRETSGFQLSAQHSRSRSYLQFEDDTKPVLEQQTAVASFGYFFASGWSVGLSGGVVFGGTLEGDGHDLTFGPGWLVSARVAWRFLDQEGPVPFMIGSLTASFSMSGKVWGTDVRLGLTVGYTLFDVLQVYISPRFFGGPVFIDRNGERTRGSDRFFFQVGLGTALLLPAGFTLFFDGSPGPEQTLTGGLAFSF